MLDRKELKQKARASIRAVKPSPVWVTLMVGVILLVTQGLSFILGGDLEMYRSMLSDAASGQMVQMEATRSVELFPWLLTLALDVMTMVITVGFTLYLMRVGRRQSPAFGDVFDAFGVFFRSVWVSILRGVLISLWSFIYALPAALLSVAMDPVLASVVCLPLLIPMFMAAYSYRLAVYIMLDNPGYSALQCLALSRMAMKGRRWELFVLDLSFIGWYLLCILPPAALWVLPYTGVTDALWYDRVMPVFLEELRNRPMPRPMDYPAPPSDWSTPGEHREDDDHMND